MIYFAIQLVICMFCSALLLKGLLKTYNIQQAQQQKTQKQQEIETNNAINDMTEANLKLAQEIELLIKEYDMKRYANVRINIEHDYIDPTKAVGVLLKEINDACK